MAKQTTKEITNETIVKVINNSDGSLSFRDMHERKHLFARQGAFKNIEFELIEALFYESPAMIEQGHIIFEDKSVYERLGIGEEIYSKLLPVKELEKILSKDADEIKEIIEDAPAPIKENLARVAKNKKIDSNKKIKAIKEATGFDVKDYNEEE